MIQASNISLQFGGRVLFKDVNLKFTTAMELLAPMVRGNQHF